MHLFGNARPFPLNDLETTPVQLFAQTEQTTAAFFAELGRIHVILHCFHPLLKLGETLPDVRAGEFCGQQTANMGDSCFV